MKTITQSLLDEVTGRLAAEFQPEQVWLFGSHAWGQPDDGSDLDLFVVIPQSDETPVRRFKFKVIDLKAFIYRNKHILKRGSQLGNAFNTDISHTTFENGYLSMNCTK